MVEEKGENNLSVPCSPEQTAPGLHTRPRCPLGLQLRAPPRTPRARLPSVPCQHSTRARAAAAQGSAPGRSWRRPRGGVPAAAEPGLRATARLGRRSGGMRRCRGAGLAALAALLLVAVARAQVQQEPFLETIEGTGINITCSHGKIGTNDWIQWYRLLPGRGPELIAVAARGSKDVPAIAGKLSVSEDRRSSALWLAWPRRGDAAVYYCALAGNANRLTFGSGTRLLVKTKVTPSPSVYRLTSKDAQGLEMCLITDYSPEQLTLSSAEQHTSAVVGVATAESSEESSYLSTYWARREQLHCAASHEGFGELEGEDPESGASAVCVTGLSLHFRTDEHLNTLSLSQLGLKIVLMKAVIFNVLMSVLVWKKKKD